ncbi:MAG: hypothetical protein K0U68_08985 [Gammaproteobacteria bacterium]|nr:hypothetical protein [Gammaproteobacteria bacterium]
MNKNCFLAGLFLVSSVVPGLTHASAIASVVIDWSSLTITADGLDVTNSINWSNQFDNAETSLIEGSVSGSPVINNHDIDPNPGWASTRNVTDGQITSKGSIGLSNSSLSATTLANYTGKAESTVIRHGEFNAEAATYTFSVNYTASIELNTNTTEAGSAFAYAEILLINETTRSDSSRDNVFFFEFIELDMENLGNNSLSGMLTATKDFNDNDLAFLQGDLITLDITARADSRSISSMAPVPIPPALLLFVSGFSMLFYRLKKN